MELEKQLTKLLSEYSVLNTTLNGLLANDLSHSEVDEKMTEKEKELKPYLEEYINREEIRETEDGSIDNLIDSLSWNEIFEEDDDPDCFWENIQYRCKPKLWHYEDQSEGEWY